MERTSLLVTVHYTAHNKVRKVVRRLHCFCVIARVRKVMKAATAKVEKKAPTAMKNLRPLSQVRQKS